MPCQRYIVTIGEIDTYNDGWIGLKSTPMTYSLLDWNQILSGVISYLGLGILVGWQ